jgi:CRISPR-associated protein Cas8a1/Csx13
MGAEKKPPAPDHLTMSLFAPGMSPMHRAGLGGLACTLKAMERQLDGADAPWHISAQTVTLKFGKPDQARAYLQRLFAFAFKLRGDGLISLPGQYDTEPSAAVLADLQAGMTLTFLQHGKVRQLVKEPTVASYDPDESGGPGVVVQYRKCSGFKHQAGWELFVDKRGCLVNDPIKVDGPISPGTVVRHVAFTGDTAAEDPPERMLPLYFALVGCMPLPVNRGVAALLVPEVDDLKEFMLDRPAMTPTTATQCQIANAADAALQAQIRLRGRDRIAGSAVPGCYAMTFRPTPWASQQKSRVATLHVLPGDDRLLDRFARALAHLPTRVVTRIIKEAVGRGKNKSVSERKESFRADSVIRPLIAENLAIGRPWYAGFADLMYKINPATDKPYRNQLSFERKGLHDMIEDKKMWDVEGEALIVKAVHEAIRQTLGRIREETDGARSKALSQATKNRWERFQEKLRLDLVGAKTQAHARFALTDLFSRGGRNSVLRESWAKVLPVIQKDWNLARDLGLLALASYAGRGETAPVTEAAATEAP